MTLLLVVVALFRGTDQGIGAQAQAAVQSPNYFGTIPNYANSPLPTVSASGLLTDLRTRPGTLIKGSAPNVYVTDYIGGVYQKRWVDLPPTFSKFGFRWEDIYYVSDAELAFYTDGTPVTQTDTTRPNGTLLRASSSPRVYLLEEGKKRWVTSPTAFLSRGFRWNRIVTVFSDSEMVSYPAGSNLQARPGTLLKGSGPAVYVTDYTAGSWQKRWITTPTAFQSLGFQWEAIFTVSDAELSSYTDGLSLSNVSQGDSDISGLFLSKSSPRKLRR